MDLAAWNQSTTQKACLPEKSRERKPVMKTTERMGQQPSIPGENRHLGVRKIFLQELWHMCMHFLKFDFMYVLSYLLIINCCTIKNLF